MIELQKIQRKLNVPKSLFNSFGNFKYRSAEQIFEAVKPLLEEQKCFLTLSDEIIFVGDRFYVKATATITNSQGQSVSASALAREAQDKKGMDEAQVTGAASSYARKYALGGLFLIDDGQDPDSQDNSGKTAVSAAHSAPKAPTPRAAAKAAEIHAFDLNTAIKDMEKCTDLASFKAYIKDVKSRLSPEDWEKFRPLGTKKQKELQNEAKAE